MSEHGLRNSTDPELLALGSGRVATVMCGRNLVKLFNINHTSLYAFRAGELALTCCWHRDSLGPTVSPEGFLWVQLPWSWCCWCVVLRLRERTHCHLWSPSAPPSCSSLSWGTKQQMDTTEDKERHVKKYLCKRVNRCCSRRGKDSFSDWCFCVFLAHQCWCRGLWPGPGIPWFLPRGVSQRSLHWMPWPGHLQLLCKCLQLLACYYREEWDVQVSSWFIYQYLRLSEALLPNKRSIVWM